jgi:cyclophilin family peptidyl-prolyl cis-trans isomerase
VAVATDAGEFEMTFDAVRAPLTVDALLGLIEAKFFDGLLFHRVVPDFVVQGGDPRGDGTGGPGFSIRDELSPVEYRRGTAGIALSGPDTGGSQWFVTLSRQPHLDGNYATFGQVTSGLEVLDDIQQGMKIRAMKVLETP